MLPFTNQEASGIDDFRSANNRPRIQNNRSHIGQQTEIK